MKGGNSNSGNNRNGDKQQSHQRQQNLHSQVHDSLFAYLESTCSREALLRLYEDEGRGKYAAKTLLQRLSELGRQFVLRLVASTSNLSEPSSKPSAFDLDKLQLWCQNRNSHDVYHALEQMEALCIIEPLLRNDDDDKIILDTSSNNNNNNNKKQVVKLTEEYGKAIQQALTSWESSPWPEVTLEMYQDLAQKSMSTNPDKLTTPSHVTSSSSSLVAPPPTLEQLEAYTQIRWDSVLHFLVGDTVENDNNNKHHQNQNSNRYYERPPPAVIHFLEITNLMQRDPDHKSTKTEAPLVISSKGYEFMLQDVHVQVWQFILQYFYSLESHRKFEELRHEAILFLLCLSYCRVGSAYAASSLSNKHARTLMKDLKRFGLLYVTKVGGVTLFYPTRVAVNLVVGSLHMDTVSSRTNKRSRQFYNNPYVLTDDAMFVKSAPQIRSLEAALALPEPSKSPHIAILVQTNFHLCAYTTSELHVKMLSLFCDLREYRRLPNCIMTRLTRDSIKAAFALGITAAQILRFLKMNAHPQVATPSNNYSLIPPNVEDQIWLWDRERTRVQFQEVYILQCTSRAEYLSIQQYAIDHDAYAWSRSAGMGSVGAKASNNKIMLKYEKADMVMSYLRRWRAARASAAN